MTSEADMDADALTGVDAWSPAELPELAAGPVTRAAEPGPRAAGALRRRVAAPAKSTGKVREAAVDLPVARVCVDVGLAHLDRPFDYSVPAALAEIVQPGVRVRVRFAGQLLDGVVLERADASEHAGKLAFIEKVVSPVPVLAPEIAHLAREIADRYAGTLADVIRLAVPPRHARAESALLNKPARAALADVVSAPPSADAADAPAADVPASGLRQDSLDHRNCTEAAHFRPHNPAASVQLRGSGGPTLRPLAALGAGWKRYPAGDAYLHALSEGREVRAVWSALPGEDWPGRIAEAVAATLHSGRGALIVVADARDLDRVDAALSNELGTGRHVALSAAIGPEARYKRFLQALGGDVRVVVGNRAAAFAPVRDLGLAVIWDDGDDLHSEPRAPYPHAREVLLTRARHVGAAILIGGFGRTVEAAQLLDNGWAKEIAADREAVRAAAPLIAATGDDIRDPEAAAARLPSVAWRAARDALAAGHPVLVQVPRRGYLPSVACAACRTPARCAHCQGPLSLGSAGGQATCRWCARVSAGWACAACGGRGLRASIVGARRTAEELGRVFTDVPIRTSGRDGVLAEVDAKPALVVATPGAEPVVTGGGYGAVLLLDTWALLTRADLRAGEETLRRWLAAASLALPASRGGRVIVVADGALNAVQALIRFDAGWLAARDLAERRELSFPPAVRMASLSGASAALADFLAVAHLPAEAEVLGPVPLTDDQMRFLVRVPRSAGPALADALRAAQGVRSARKSPDPVRIQVDPLELL